MSADTKTLGRCECGALLKALDTATTRALGYPDSPGARWWEAPAGHIGHAHEVISASLKAAGQ